MRKIITDALAHNICHVPAPQTHLTPHVKDVDKHFGDIRPDDDVGDGGGIGGDGVGVGRQRQTIDYGTAYVI